MKTTRIERECQSCGATGLYVGIGERDGIAVQCHTCDGTGKELVEIRWEPFVKRKGKRGVTHVLETNPGICASPGVVPGGIPYKDWFQGLGFPHRGAEMREHTCPEWWYQSADYKRKPEWNECVGMGSFSECLQFKHKAECWKRFDVEGL